MDFEPWAGQYLHYPWSEGVSITATGQEPPVGFEPTTARLRIESSTTELRWRGPNLATCCAMRYCLPFPRLDRLVHDQRQHRRRDSLIVQPSAAPQVVDDWDYDQRQDCGRHHPAYHRRGDPLHHARPRTVTPQRRHEPEHDRQDGHELRPHAVDRAMLDGAHELRQRRTPPTLRDSLPGVIEVDEHHDTGFRSHASECDESDRDRDGQVVVEQPHDPYAADQGERQRQHHDCGLGYGPEREIQEQRDDSQRERDDDLEPRLHPLNRLILPTPTQPIAGREL